MWPVLGTGTSSSAVVESVESCNGETLEAEVRDSLRVQRKENFHNWKPLPGNG